MEESPVSGVIVGHSNMDLDCFGSIALARHLFPGYLAVQSRHVHPVARTMVTMYRNHLDLVPSRELKGRSVDHLVVVDTRSRDRVSEYMDLLGATPPRIDVYDHHPMDSRDIPDATVHESTLGSNTAFLGTLLMERGIRITPDDATIALTGVYADTGNFTHGNVTDADFEVAGYLLRSGASVPLVRSFLRPLREKFQVTMFHDVLNDVAHRTIRGHSVLLSHTALDGPCQGLSAVVEKIFDVENADAYFAVFSFRHNGTALIISRSSKESIEVDWIMGTFGGGGHTKAASATLKNVDGVDVFSTLSDYLETSLRPAVTAEEIMSREVIAVTGSMTLLDASLALERSNHTGCPVLGEDGELAGIITLRDIQKGRKAGQMHAPVKGYMVTKVICADPGTTVRQIEELLLTHNIGHLPVTQDKRVVGIVTRADYLAFRREEKARAAVLRDSVRPKEALA